MGWREVAVITPLVIIQSGQPNTGLFVYNGPPAAGNPPVAWLVAPGVTQDPFGNNLMTATVANAIFGAGVQGTGQVIIDSSGEMLLSGADGSNVIQLQPASQRELFYSDPAGAAALIASIALANGTDSFGNTYLAGFASQSGGITAQLFAAALRFVAQASTPASPPTVYTTLAATAGAELNLSSGKGTGPAKAATLTMLDSLLGTGGAAQAVLAALNNPVAPVSSALWEVQGKTTAVVALFNGAFSALVAGDTVDRWSVDSNGDMAWGTGGAAQDTVMYRVSAAELAADTLVANISGSAETWHSLGALGAHYTVTLGRYRMTVEGELEVDINVVGDGLQATSVTFAVTLPPAYRPATKHDVLPMGTTRQVTAGDIWPRLQVDTAGNVIVTNQGTANTFAASQRVPLN